MYGRKKDERREKLNKILVFFIAFIMIGSVFGVVFYGFNEENNNNRHKYGDYTFIEKNDVIFHWITNINGKEAGFNYLPDEVSYIKINNFPLNSAKVLQIDTTTDLDSKNLEDIVFAQKQMEITLANFNIFLRMGFTGEDEYNSTVIKCDGSSTTIPIIYFKESNETSISTEGNCIIAKGQDVADFKALRDRIVYKILDITNG